MSSRSIQFPTLDLISMLPDSILCHILSFLPTKLAIHTSVLSKRWRSLWLSVVTINVDAQTFPDFHSFTIFVYSVIVSRHVKLPIQSLTLKLCSESSTFNFYHASLFVANATQRALENLNLYISGPNIHNKIRLPLSCKTLKVLKLNNIFIDCLPNVVDFPLLKTLYLCEVCFSRYEYFVNLLVPNIEDLKTDYIGLYDWDKNFQEHEWRHYWEGKDNKTLPKLFRADISYVDIPFHLLYSVQYLRAELHASYYLNNIPTFHNLTTMELTFNSKSWHGRWKWMVQVLQHCPKLEYLAVHEVSNYRNGFRGEDWEDPKIVPECLSSQFKICNLWDYQGRECELHFAKYIMQNSKLLRTMNIRSKRSLDKLKLQMLKKLSQCSRASATCELLFD